MIQLDEREHTLAIRLVARSTGRRQRPRSYTDGITEAQDGFGDMLGRDRLMTWARMAPIDNPSSTGRFLLKRLSEFRHDNFTDDETIITIQKR